MAHEYDPFELGSGLPLADTDVVITAMEFRFDTQYAADACVAAITFQPDDGETQEQLYSCGKGWEPVDRGASVAHTSGRDMNINKQSNYGRFLQAAFECEGFLDDARETGYTPLDSALLIGRGFHLIGLDITTRNPSKPDAADQVKTIIVPDAYHGVAEEGEETEEETEEEEEDTPPPKAAAKKVAAKKAAPTAKKAAAKKSPATTAIERKQIALIAALEEEDGEMVAGLRELAAESDTHEEFMEAAMELDGVAESETAQQVAMSSKPGSIWATRED